MSQKESLLIKGGTPLYGSVYLGGAKNASYKLMIAALLADEPVRLLNLSEIDDVHTVANIIASLGGSVLSRGERTLSIDGAGLKYHQIDQKYGDISRASTLFIPILLHKFNQAAVPLPGGDKIGARPLERHFQGLEAMGASIKTENGFIHVESPQGLHGTTYRFAKNSHTGTETLIMAAVLAQGKTILENAAAEPEVDDLILLLKNMGAKIRRLPDDARTIEITGVAHLHGAIHRLMPDRNEAVTYACAALATGGDVILQNANPDHLAAFLEKVDELGASFEIGDYGIRFFTHPGTRLQAVNLETRIHPGFMTDWQPLWATLVCHAAGTSIIHETIMQSRFQYVSALQAMGAQIEYFQPQVANPEQTYNFNLADAQPEDKHAIKITGPTHFIGGEFTIQDLRMGATLILAALTASTPTVLHNIGQVERGYEKLPEKLVSLGAKINKI